MISGLSDPLFKGIDWLKDKSLSLLTDRIGNKKLKRLIRLLGGKVKSKDIMEATLNPAKIPTLLKHNASPENIAEVAQILAGAKKSKGGQRLLLLHMAHNQVQKEIDEMPHQILSQKFGTTNTRDIASHETFADMAESIECGNHNNVGYMIYPDPAFPVLCTLPGRISDPAFILNTKINISSINTSRILGINVDDLFHFISNGSKWEQFPFIYEEVVNYRVLSAAATITRVTTNLCPLKVFFDKPELQIDLAQYDQLGVNSRFHSVLQSQVVPGFNRITIPMDPEALANSRPMPNSSSIRPLYSAHKTLWIVMDPTYPSTTTAIAITPSGHRDMDKPNWICCRDKSNRDIIIHPDIVDQESLEIRQLMIDPDYVSAVIGVALGNSNYVVATTYPLNLELSIVIEFGASASPSTGLGKIANRTSTMKVADVDLAGVSALIDTYWCISTNEELRFLREHARESVLNICNQQ
jgi:hypothetical protein